jgi:phosphatidate cytidylyltransferase
MARAEPEAKPNGADSVGKKQTLLQKFVTRACMGAVMFSVFCAIIWAGHLYVCGFVVLLQALIFRELVNVRYRADCEIIVGRVPLFRTLQWAWYGVATFYTYGDFLYEFSSQRWYLAHITRALRYHGLIAFAMYCLLFVFSICTLRASTLKYQVQQLTWTIVTLCLVIGQMKFVAHNIFFGLFWFFFPCFLVIANDCWAYAWGLTLGRKLIKETPFFRLSPNKTWEGFIGAAFSTVIMGFFVAGLFAQIRYLTCPAERLTFRPHHGVEGSCTPHPIFELGPLPFPGDALRALLPDAWQGTSLLPNVVMVRPVQLHGAALSLFASVVAPFGGFLASAIKRAYGVKDFDSLIPGHGGVTDRMDCQFLMALCTWVYLHSFVMDSSTVSGLFAHALLLEPAQQRELYDQLREHLVSTGVLLK